MEISLIVLAAGKSSRTGTLGRKPLLPWPVGPGSLLGQVLENLKNAHPWYDAIVVHRGDSPIYRRIIKDAGSPFREIENSDANAPMSSSLKRGLAAIPKSTDGVMIALGDMPFINTSIIKSILSKATPDSIVQPWLRDRPTNPVFFPSTLFQDLQKAQGDQGGRTVIRENPHKVTRVNFEDPEPFRDIDTSDDYSKAVQSLR